MWNRIDKSERDLRTKEKLWTSLYYIQPVATKRERGGQDGRDMKLYGQWSVN